MKWTKNGSVLYHTAALGILLEPDKNEQSYFIRHEEDIVSLAIHPNSVIAATGQMAQAGKAKMIEIYVWNTETKEVLACLKGFHRRAIRHVLFIVCTIKIIVAILTKWRVSSIFRRR